MPTERVIHAYDSDNDVVVVDGGGGTSVSTVLGILIVLVILAAVWWFALGPGMSGTNTDVNVNPPPAENQPAAS